MVHQALRELVNSGVQAVILSDTCGMPADVDIVIEAIASDWLLVNLV